ncbi:MAG: hypothetical protein U1E76_27070 [Planctomycetota bacterium]
MVATCSVGAASLAKSISRVLAAQSFLGENGAKLIALCATISMTGYNAGVALITPALSSRPWRATATCRE